MAIQYEIRIEDDLLSATARGTSDSISELRRYGAALVLSLIHI